MIKKNEVYIHEKTGIEFEVTYTEQKVCINLSHDLCGHDPMKKSVRIMPSQQSGWQMGEKGFVFKNSRPDRVVEIGRALTDIGEFVEKL